jgi:hypothetical protein
VVRLTHHSGEVFATMPLLPNWYRVSNSSVAAYPCSAPGVCLGGRDVSQQCIEGHEGPLCDNCILDWYRQDDAFCKPCPATGAEDSIIIFGVIVLTGLVLLLVLLRLVQRASSSRRRGSRLARAVEFCGHRGANISIKLKILVSLSQLIRGAGFVFQIKFPPIFDQLTKWLGSVLQVDLPNIIPLGCIQRLTYIELLVLRTAFPMLLTFVSIIISVALKTLHRRGHGTKAQIQAGGEAVTASAVNITKAARKPLSALLNGLHSLRNEGASANAGAGQQVALLLFLSSAASSAAFVIVYLVFPIASVAVIQFFVCDDLDVGGGQVRSLLRVDTSIDCNGEVYLSWLPYAIGMLFVYPVGVPGYFALLLFRHRYLLKNKLKVPSSVARITSGYKSTCYWFELFESMRKLVVVGLPCAFPTGSFEQLFFGIVTCFLTWGSLLMLR